MSTEVIKLEGSLDISKVDSLFEQFQNCLTKGADLTVEAEDVNRVDTASLQLLLAFHSEFKKSGYQWAWGSYSEDLSTAANLLGVYDLLGLTKTELH